MQLEDALICMGCPSFSINVMQTDSIIVGPVALLVDKIPQVLAARARFRARCSLDIKGLLQALLISDDPFENGSEHLVRTIVDEEKALGEVLG